MLGKNYVAVETTVSKAREYLDLCSRSGVWCARDHSEGRRIRIPPLVPGELTVDYAYLDPERFGNSFLEVSFELITSLSEIIHRDFERPCPLNAAASLALSLEWSSGVAAETERPYSFLGVPYLLGDGVDLHHVLEEIQDRMQGCFISERNHEGVHTLVGARYTRGLEILGDWPFAGSEHRGS